MDKNSYSGVWWLPNYSEHIYGELKIYNDGHSDLSLTGHEKDFEKTLGIRFDNSRGIPRDLPIILGMSDGKNITLVDCKLNGFSGHSDGLVHVTYTITSMFIDAHFKTLEDIVFSSVYVDFSNLFEWVDISGINFQRPSGRHSINITYNMPNKIQLAKVNNYIVTLGFGNTLSLGQNTSILQNTYIQITSSSEEPIRIFFEIIKYIANFLSLATNETVYPTSILGITSHNPHHAGSFEHYPIVRIYQKSLLKLDNTNTMHIPDYLFSFKDIAPDFNQLINRWFEKGSSEKLEPIYESYFAIIYNMNTYPKQKFLSLVQSLETYHRRFVNNNDLPLEQHEKRLNEILSATPEEYKKWLNGKLSHSNEPFLAQRLGWLYDRYSSLWIDDTNIKKYKKAKNRFVSKVTSTRHYNTHHSPELKEQAAEDKELDDLSEKLKIILSMCLLEELGFDNDKVKNIVQKHKNIINALEKI